MGYSFSPSARDERARAFFSKKGRHLAIAAAIIFFIGTFYLVGNTLTGYVTYSKSLESRLNDTRQQLTNLQDQNNACQSSLDAANSGVNNLNSSLNACSSNLSYYKPALETCFKDNEKLANSTNALTDSLNSCENARSSSIESYKQLARSSVKAICCSFGDVQSASIRNWNILNNSIACSGNYTVNCTSGETNY